MLPDPDGDTSCSGGFGQILKLVMKHSSIVTIAVIAQFDQEHIDGEIPGRLMIIETSGLKWTYPVSLAV